MIYSSNYGARWHLSSASFMPRAFGRLSNAHRNMIVSCQGKVVVKNPCTGEQSHLVRRFYLTEGGQSQPTVLPYSEANDNVEMFDFSVGDGCLTWDTCYQKVDVRLVATLPVEDDVELWSITLANRSAEPRDLKLYPAFSFKDYQSKNNSAEYRPDLEGIVASSLVTQSHRGESECQLRQQYVLHEFPPLAWHCREDTFIGDAHWQSPGVLRRAELDCDESHQWVTPIAAFQYNLTLAPGESKTLRFMMGEGGSKTAILRLRDRYLFASGFSRVLSDNQIVHRDSKQGVQFESPDPAFNHFINRWLCQQVLSAKPRSMREVLANILALVFVDPAQARVETLQFLESGHLSLASRTSGYAQSCAELIIVIKAYQEETGDVALLRELINVFGKRVSVFECLNGLVCNLAKQIDDRGLLDTRRGDEEGTNWRSLRACSGATFSGIYTLEHWADICECVMLLSSLAKEYRTYAENLRAAADQYLWCGEWFANGVSVRGKRQGGAANLEGKVHLKPQSWALLAGSKDKQPSIIGAVESHLKTQYGLLNVWPAYTKLDDESAAWLRWQPGTGLNASHLASDSAQYAYALYEVGESERGFEVLCSVLPCLEQGEEERWGVIPTYIPDYVSGPADGDESWAGKASLDASDFALGWVYLALERGLLGIRGTENGVSLEPRLPTAWYGLKAVKHIRGATLYISVERDNSLARSQMQVDGVMQTGLTLAELEPGRRYQVDIALARHKRSSVYAPDLAVVKM